MGEELGWVYFVRAPDLHLVKVGFTADHEGRLRNLQTGSPFDLELVDVYQGTKADERRMQALLKPHLFKREWFRWDEEVEELLEDIWEYQIEVAGETPLATQTGEGKEWADHVLEQVGLVPISGFWEWRERQ